MWFIKKVPLAQAYPRQTASPTGGSGWGWGGKAASDSSPKAGSLRLGQQDHRPPTHHDCS